MSEPEVDLITLSVLWNSLLSIAEEMASTLRRTAFSKAVREGDDFSTALFDRHARLIAQGNCTPGHLGAMPYVVRGVLEYYPGDALEDGDAVFVNDSLIGSGHYPDCFLLQPIFACGRLAGYTVNIAHHTDVGGAVPGSEIVDGVTEAYQEGIRVLPVKLMRGGEFDEDLMRLFLGNVRLPELVRGDLLAQRNANHIGATGLKKLVAEYGFEGFERYVEEILVRSEAQMRAHIREMPDGVYGFTDHFDDYGPGTEPIRVHVDVTIDGDEVVADFSKSSDQVSAGINSYINYTRAYASFAIKVFAGASLTQNDGTVRPVTITAREGSFFNPVFPAPSSGRAAVQIRIYDAINGALAQAVPGRAMAAFSHWSNPKIGGVDERTGRRFVMYDMIFGGYGACAYKDGVEALSTVINCANIPVEVNEQDNPVIVRRLEILADTGGAGKFRGGCGVRKDIELRSDATLSLLGDRNKFQPYGLFGGQPGALGEMILNPDTNHAEALHSKEVRRLKKGDVVSIRISGGGGLGNVAERDPAAVARDVEEGYVSPEAAKKVYGRE